jgi:uncharacterized damage-inducible protein DinB
VRDKLAIIKDDLVRYLQRGREALVWKLDGLREYDIRRPMVKTGTNLLGLVKHVAGVEAGYFGEVFGRPFPQRYAWMTEDAEENSDMWATTEESREFVIDAYRQVWAHADETIAALDLDSTGLVPWWPAGRQNVTLHLILSHVVAETQRHAGHADILRELIDGDVGVRPDVSNLTRDFDWDTHRERLEAAARAVD